MVINPHGMEFKVLLVCQHVELASSQTMDDWFAPIFYIASYTAKDCVDKLA